MRKVESQKKKIMVESLSRVENNISYIVKVTGDDAFTSVEYTYL